MAINLTKGTGIVLDKGLQEVVFTVSWDTTADVDIHCFLTKGGKARVDQDFVFYNEAHLHHPSGAVHHSGDIRNGSHATGIDDEYITFNLPAIPAEIDEVVLTTSIDNALLHGMHFGKIPNAVAKVINKANNEVLATYHLDRDLIGEHVAKLARLIKVNGLWKFEIISEPVASLESLVIGMGL